MRAVWWLVGLLVAVAPAAATGRVALTFDDGPRPDFNPGALRLFADVDVQVTFFYLGTWVDSHPGLARAAAEAGHELGNHSYSHPDLTALGTSGIADELRRTSDAIARATGVRPALFRPPSGLVNDRVRRVAGELGLVTVLWTVDPKDWSRQATPRGVTRHVLSNLRDGAVILLHERRQTLELLPELIRGIRAAGYAIVPYGRLGEPAPPAAAPRPTPPDPPPPPGPLVIDLDGAARGDWRDASTLRFRLRVSNRSGGTLRIRLAGEASQTVRVAGGLIGSFAGETVLTIELPPSATDAGCLEMTVGGEPAHVTEIAFDAGR